MRGLSFVTDAPLSVVAPCGFLPFLLQEGQYPTCSFAGTLLRRETFAQVGYFEDVFLGVHFLEALAWEKLYQLDCAVAYLPQIGARVRVRAMGEAFLTHQIAWHLLFEGYREQINRVEVRRRIAEEYRRYGKYAAVATAELRALVTELEEEKL